MFVLTIVVIIIITYGVCVYTVQWICEYVWVLLWIVGNKRKNECLKKRWGHLWWFAVIVCDWILTIHTENPESNEYNFDVNNPRRRYQCLSLSLSVTLTVSTPCTIYYNSRQTKQRTPVCELSSANEWSSTENSKLCEKFIRNSKREKRYVYTNHPSCVFLCDSKVLFQQSMGIKFHFNWIVHHLFIDDNPTHEL